MVTRAGEVADYYLHDSFMVTGVTGSLTEDGHEDWWRGSLLLT